MRKYTLLALFLLAVLSPFAQGLKIFISHKAFCTNNLQPYIEYTFIVGGNTVNYVPNKHHKYEAAVEIRVDMMKGDSLVEQLHYILNSDQFADTVRATKPDFADIQNVRVPQGNYFLYFYVRDVNGNTAALRYIDRILVDFPETVSPRPRFHCTNPCLRLPRPVFSSNMATSFRRSIPISCLNRNTRCLSLWRSIILRAYWVTAS